ncbi:hypothetical protein ACFC1T_14535 [Kitasatospora sp. NPDC056076]|uniref:hypothetical protein n=1 Tax=Kitasatospora sp. NPDC056076 TaxID=3345703 RepID=UPI0035DC85E4
MTIPASSAPAARLWLFNALKAALTADPGTVSGQGSYGDANASLLVCLDAPGTYQPEDIVAVGKVDRRIDVSSMVGSGGAGWLIEHYTIEITVECARGTDDSQSAFERTCSLIDQITAVVRTDPTLGGNVLWSQPTRSETDTVWADDHSSWVGQGTLTVDCNQRI